jgi:hypothetical protein
MHFLHNTMAIVLYLVGSGLWEEKLLLQF